MYYSGQPIFWSCQTGDDDQINIFTQPGAGNCSEIRLIADTCRPACANSVPEPSPSLPGGSSPPPPPPGPSSPAPSGPSTLGGSTSPTTATETSTSTNTATTPPSSSAHSLPSVTPFLPTTPPGSDTSPTTDTTTNISPSSPPSSPPSSSPSSSVPPPQPTPSNCPTDVAGDGWEYPHLMVPVDRANPAMAYGPSFFGQLSPNASTLYNFDIPPTDGGKTCSLFFAFPSATDVNPLDYTFTFTPTTGNGAANFVFLQGPAASSITFDTVPLVAADLGSVELRPGNRYIISNFPCPAGQRISFAIRAPVGTDTCLYWLQDILPVPFGLYISKC